ncbi:MAG: LysR family transcriptional regulator [Synergistaceae bacterium]|nr:LysR family transcriptional regulator [Synergistaceae bacterium]
MELKNINAFLRVAELNNFTKAAAELGYSQSSVTVQIQQLEKELGFALFDRIGKSVSLTPMGEIFIGYANEFLRLESKTKALKENAGVVSGTLRLGVLESLFVWKVADLLPQFHSKYPAVKIEIKSATGAALYRMLRQNELDIIYLLDYVIYHRDCVRACTSPVSLKFVAAAGSELSGRKDIPLAEIMKEPLILTERDAIYRRELDQEAARNDIELEPFLEVDNLEVVLRLLKKQMGVSFLPDYVLHESVNSGELALLDVRYNVINLWSQLVYHKNKFITPQMQAFIQLIRESSSSIS